MGKLLWVERHLIEKKMLVGWSIRPTRSTPLLILKLHRSSNDSIDFFTVYTMKDGCRVRLLCNEDFVEPDDLNFCIRTLVFFWSKNLYNEQWEVLY